MLRPPCSRFWFLSLLFLASATRPLPAQGGAERLFVDSLFHDLARAHTTEQLPRAERCGGREATVARLCEGLRLTRVAEFSGQGDDAIKAEALLRRAVDDRPKWATAWYGLGVARLELARAKVLAKEGPLQVVGLSFEAGAGNALVRALELDSTLSGAAEALALAPIPREGASQLGARARALRRLRYSLPLSPSARFAMARIEREAGNVDTAIVYLHEAMAQGADTGLVDLELARDLHLAGRPAEGRAALIAGAVATGSPLAAMRYREELAWVATPEELHAWDSLPLPQRSTWLDVFWASRDVREGREPGERLIEHYRRVELAMSNFRIAIPQKGRQRLRSTAIAGDLMDLNGGGSVVGSGNNGSSRVSASESAQSAVTASQDSYAATLGADVPFRQFGIGQDVLDDRGVIWIRHGKPDREQGTIGGTAKAVWMYDRPGEAPLVLFFAEVDFDGTSGASVLIPTPIGSDGQALEQLCGQINGMCDRLQPGNTVGVAGNGRFGAGRSGALTTGRVPAPNLVADDRGRGTENIVRAVTTDAYPRKFTAPLDPVVQVYGLERSSGGAPRLVVAFAIPGGKLNYATPPEAGGRAVYPIHVKLISVDRTTGERRELDTLRQFAAAKPLVEGEWLTGMLSVPAATYGASLLLTQDDGRGALARLATVRVPGALPQLDISSVVLGREGTGVRWNSGATVVALNPLNAYQTGATAELYYQLSGLVPGTEYDTRLEFFSTLEDSKPPKLSLGFKTTATQPRAEIGRSVALGKLPPGSYRLRVTVRGGGTAASESATLVVRKP
ncbi:MAG: hypothetical protein V4503_09105 [Gemmatimonadota bacterium]